MTIPYPFVFTSPTPQGWQCPQCRTVYAPHVPACYCATLRPVVTYDGGSSTPPGTR
jgi:hypothetical protein